MLECYITLLGLQVLARLDDDVNQADVAALEGLTDREIALAVAIAIAVAVSGGGAWSIAGP